MALEHHFYMDTSASRHELRGALLQAGLGFQVGSEWKVPSTGGVGVGAFTEATSVSILDDLSGYTTRPDNGVIATRSVCFRDRKAYLSKPEAAGQFERQTTLGIMALLRAFPEADAYWEAYDARVPLLLRQVGRLILSEAETKPGEFWDPDHAPTRTLVDLPYVVEPLGPWEDVPVGAPELEERQ
jgi:hypothetical protein